MERIEQALEVVRSLQRATKSLFYQELFTPVLIGLEAYNRHENSLKIPENG